MVRCVATAVEELKDDMTTFLIRFIVIGKGVFGRNCAGDASNGMWVNTRRKYLPKVTIVRLRTAGRGCSSNGVITSTG